MTAAAHSFETLFDQSPHVVGQAPAVVPLAGDLRSAGPAIAIAAPLATHVLVARRRDPVVHAASANDAGPARSVFVLGEESAWGTWVDWVQGVTVALRESGHELPGFDLLVRSNVRCGVGLGSSTALVVALLRALRDAYALGFDDHALVTLAHRAESAFIARPSSRAAIEACVFASERHALLVEDGVARERIALPDDMEATLFLGSRPVVPAPEERVEMTAAGVVELAEALRAGHPEEIGALLEAIPGPRCELLASTRRHPSVYGARCVREGGAVVALVRRGSSIALRAA